MLRDRLVGLLRDTEEANRRALIDALPDRCDGPMLDIGPHTGELTARVAQRLGATDVHGVELIGDHIEAAAAHGINVVQADVDEGLPYPDDDVRLRARQPGHRARPPHRHVPARDPPRAAPGRHRLHLDEQPRLVAQRDLARTRLPADADARQRRGHPRQPAQSRARTRARGPRPHAPAAVHDPGARRAGRASRPRAASGLRPSATTRCRRRLRSWRCESIPRHGAFQVCMLRPAPVAIDADAAAAVPGSRRFSRATGSVSANGHVPSSSGALPG